MNHNGMLLTQTFGLQFDSISEVTNQIYMLHELPSLKPPKLSQFYQPYNLRQRVF